MAEDATNPADRVAPPNAVDPQPPAAPAAPLPPLATLRRLTRQYGWLAAAGAFAVLVLVGSAPFASGPPPTWEPAEPAAAKPATTPAPDEPTAPPATQTPSGPPATPSPAASRTTANPSVVRTTPRRSPVLLGPATTSALYDMLRNYCVAQYGSRDAQLRTGTSPAEGNWECQVPRENPLIDMTAACRGTYGNTAFAAYLDQNDAFSWRCYRR